MRKFCFLAVAAAAVSLLSADQAQAGGRRTRYYSYGSPVASQRAPSQAAQPNQAAQSTTTRRYSYAPSSGARYSYSPASRSFVMGSTPYTYDYWRADRKIRGY